MSFFFVYIIKRTLHRGLKIRILFSRGKNNIYERAQRGSKILFCLSKIKFISSRHRVISSMYLAHYIVPIQHAIDKEIEKLPSSCIRSESLEFKDNFFPMTDILARKHFLFLFHFSLREIFGIDNRVSEQRLTVFAEAKFCSRACAENKKKSWKKCKKKSKLLFLAICIKE